MPSDVRHLDIVLHEEALTSRCAKTGLFAGGHFSDKTVKVGAALLQQHVRGIKLDHPGNKSVV